MGEGCLIFNKLPRSIGLEEEQRFMNYTYSLRNHVALRMT